MSKLKGSLGPVAGASSSSRSRLSFVEDDLLNKIGTLKEIPKGQISPDPNQPRKEITPEALAELTLSLEEHGQLQPIVVTETEEGIGQYRIVFGERRWRAAMASEKVENLTAIIRSDLTDDLRVLLAQIAENIHRANMNPLETAHAYKRVYDTTGQNAEETAKLLGISKSRLSQVLAVDEAPEAVKELVQEGVTSDVNVVAGLSVLAQLDAGKAEVLINQARTGELKGGGLREAVKDKVREVKAENKKTKQPKQQPEQMPVEPSANAENSTDVVNIEVPKVTPVTAPEPVITEGDDLMVIRLKRSIVDKLKRLVATADEDGETVEALMASLESASLE